MAAHAAVSDLPSNCRDIGFRFLGSEASDATVISGEKLVEIRDDLTLQVHKVGLHGWMQHIRDIPLENLPEATKIILPVVLAVRDAEVELLRLKREQ